MKQLTLHVGPHKTGTTSIQYYLHSNRQELADQGVAYPSFFPPLPCHNQLALAFAEGNGGSYLQIALNALDESPRGIMSGEEFSVPQRPGLKAGLEFLESRFRLDYVFVHRDPVDRLASYVIHSAPSGGLNTSTAGGAVRHIADGYLFHKQQLKYFVDRGALIIEYEELDQRGIQWFADTAFGVHLPPAEKRLNAGESHTTKILALDVEDRGRLAAWLDSKEVTDILLSGDATRSTVLSAAVKARVREILGQV